MTAKSSANLAKMLLFCHSFVAKHMSGWSLSGYPTPESVYFPGYGKGYQYGTQIKDNLGKIKLF